MRIRGFLALFLLVVVFIFILYVMKGKKEERVVEAVKAFNETKREVTKSNMGTLQRIIVSFIAAEGRVPKNLRELQRLYIQPFGRLDAWGTEIMYERISEDSFRLISAGEDRIFDTDDDIDLEY